jgi:hypothetical protein
MSRRIGKGQKSAARGAGGITLAARIGRGCAAGTVAGAAISGAGWHGARAVKIFSGGGAKARGFVGIGTDLCIEMERGRGAKRTPGTGAGLRASGMNGLESAPGRRMDSALGAEANLPIGDNASRNRRSSQPGRPTVVGPKLPVVKIRVKVGFESTCVLAAFEPVSRIHFSSRLFSEMNTERNISRGKDAAD